jgi:hypothetical protein
VGTKGLTLKIHSLVDLGVSSLGLNWLFFEEAHFICLANQKL